MSRLRSLALITSATLAVSLLLSRPGAANSDAIAAICDSAAVVAARETGVPLDVLRAISLTETGRKSGEIFSPWPWTVNMEGVGKWFDDAASAQRYVDAHFRRGARSFDVGCFQINYKWHGAAFASVAEMFDPITNARYAARFLAELHGEFRDWSKAAGAYHSRTPKYAHRYAARFDRIRARLPEPADLPTRELPLQPLVASARENRAVRENRYPFLVTRARAGGASLVPLLDDGRQFIAMGPGRPLLELP